MSISRDEFVACDANLFLQSRLVRRLHGETVTEKNSVFELILQHGRRNCKVPKSKQCAGVC